MTAQSRIGRLPSARMISGNKLEFIIQFMDLSIGDTFYMEYRGKPEIQYEKKGVTMATVVGGDVSFWFNSSAWVRIDPVNAFKDYESLLELGRNGGLKQFLKHAREKRSTV